MMSFLRGKVARVILWVLLVAFLSWIVAELGMQGRVAGPRGEAAIVNGEGISLQEFSMLYNQELEGTWKAVRSSLTEADEEKLRGEVMDRLIDQNLLWQEAKRLDCAVEADAAQAAIKAMPAFRNAKGQFDPVTYQAVLRRVGLPPPLFELQHERSLSVARLETFLREGVRVTDLELWLEYLRWHRRMRALVLSFPLREAKAEIKITDEEVEDFWHENRSLYEKPERVRIRHIWMASRPEGGPDALAQAKAQAQAVLEELKKGRDFAELAKQKSNDATTAARGGDLGWHSRGRLIPEYEEVVFKLKSGETSGIVQTSSGYSIIKCEKHEKEEKPTFDEIKGKIRDRIITERAREKISREAVRASWYLKKQDDSDLDRAAGKLERSTVRTGWFEWGGKRPAGLSSKAFEVVVEHLAGMEPGEVSDVISAEDGFYLVRLLEEKYGRAPEAGFLKERERIEPALLRRKRKAAVEAWVKRLRSEGKIKILL